MDWSLCHSVDRNPDKLEGVWCFNGTRLAVTTLFESLDLRSTVDEFLEAFPDVDPVLIPDVLSLAKSSLAVAANAA